MDDLKNKHQVNESVYFNLYGKYIIASDGDRHFITKKEHGYKVDYGSTVYRNKFDSIGGRKDAYGTTEAKVIAHSFGTRSTRKSLKGGATVEVYRNKNKNKGNYKKNNRK